MRSSASVGGKKRHGYSWRVRFPFRVHRICRVRERLLAKTKEPPRAVAFKIADPDRFDGTRGHLRGFKAGVENKLLGNAEMFPTLGGQLAYVVGLLKGRAQDQIEAQRQPDGSLPYSSRQELFAVLDQAFGDPDEMGSAQRKIMELCQGGRPFSDYYAKFQRLATLSELETVGLKSYLEKGLTLELANQLNTINTEVMTVAELAQICQQVDNRARRNAAARHPRFPSTPAVTTTARPAVAAAPAGAQVQSYRGGHRP